MKVFNAIINLVYTYLSKKNSMEASENFCEEYMEMFFTRSDELEQELSQECFEILDDLNLICDSYEKNPDLSLIHI